MAESIKQNPCKKCGNSELVGVICDEATNKYWGWCGNCEKTGPKVIATDEMTAITTAITKWNERN